MYARSLEEWGTPLHLEESDGWVLARPIGQTSHRDAMGVFPVMVCADWSRIGADIERLPQDLVSLTLVADPFGNYRPADLEACFDSVHVIKDRFIADLSVPIERRVSAHHRQQARKALRRLEVEVVERPIDRLDEWATLFSNTVARHAITGIRAYSRRAFEVQLQTPGVVMLRAFRDGQTSAINLWFSSRDAAYGHLAGIADSGYSDGASYALYWFASEWFAGRAAWLDLGGVAGARSDGQGGLAYFKRGWSTGTRPTYLCGRVLNRPVYHSLAHDEGSADSGYFPAYRAGEFG